MGELSAVIFAIGFLILMVAVSAWIMVEVVDFFDQRKK